MFFGIGRRRTHQWSKREVGLMQRCLQLFGEIDAKEIQLVSPLVCNTVTCKPQYAFYESYWIVFMRYPSSQQFFLLNWMLNWLKLFRCAQEFAAYQLELYSRSVPNASVHCTGRVSHANVRI